MTDDPDDDELVFSDICEIVERNWHNRLDQPELPLDPDDGVRHISDQARNAATEILARVGAGGDTLGAELAVRYAVELLAEEAELFDRHWWYRHTSGQREPADLIKALYWEGIAAEHAANLEAKYGKDTLTIANDYDLGVLHGRLMAIRWALGADHNNLDS